MRARAIWLAVVVALMAGAAVARATPAAQVVAGAPVGATAAAAAPQAAASQVRAGTPVPVPMAAAPRLPSASPAGTPVADSATAAAKTVGVRTGDHGAFGRVVFDVAAGQTDSEAKNGDRLVVRLAGAGNVHGAVSRTRHVAAVEGGRDQATLMMAPGSRPRVWRSAGHVVVDVYGAADPGAAAAGGAGVGAGLGEAVVAAPQAGGGAEKTAVSPRAGMAAGTQRGAMVAALPARSGEGEAALPHAVARVDREPLRIDLVPVGPPFRPAARGANTENVAKPSAAEGARGAQGRTEPRSPALASPAAAGPAGVGAVATNGLAAVALPSDPGSHEEAILVPFDSTVGAASFAFGGQAHVVFDDSKPVDLAGVKDSRAFGAARVTLLAAATHLQLTLPAGARLRLRHRSDGWVITVGPAGPAEDAAPVSAKDGVVTIGAASAADTVAMEDPATGGRLLVGTVHETGAPVAVAHLSPEFALLPSWVGVVVAVRSDRLVLRAGKGGFQLRTAGGPKLAVVLAGPEAQALAEGGTLTRHFDFAPLSAPELLSRMRSEIGTMAAAPRQGRLRPRLHAVQDMLALGLDREAAGLLRLAMQDDPTAVQNADAVALLAMADWLAGQGDGAGGGTEAGAGVGGQALTGTDEGALWRALMQPRAPGAKAAASVLAANWRLLLAYPAPLRRRLMPAAAALLLDGGETDAAAALLARVADPALDDARAALQARQGHTKEALAMLDRLSVGADRKRAAAAARSAVELRLAAGQMSPAGAATALGKLLYAWREDPTELKLRLRVADLHVKAGEWRPALQLLRETDALFSEAHEQVSAAERAALSALLKDGAGSRLAPLDLVSLVAENADLLADKVASATLTPVLVDKLVALDLPERAAPLLARLMDATADGGPKGELGARLAALRLDQSDGAGAVAALDASGGGALGPGLAARRTVLRARALDTAGQGDSALRLLEGLGDSEALDVRASMLERRRDWPGAVAALRALLAATLPPTGTLTDAQQDCILRLAGAASQAGDSAVLQALQAGPARRLPPGPRLELFRALTVQPVQSLGDLPRSARETAAAQALPAVLASYPAH